MGNGFRKVISYLIYSMKWYWLEYFINALCVFEMNIRCTAERKLSRNIRKIPKGIYCYALKEICPYWSYSHLARFFYGEQCSGFCYFINEGDFNSNTQILWDQCKCCNVNDEEDTEECISEP